VANVRKRKPRGRGGRAPKLWNPNRKPSGGGADEEDRCEEQTTKKHGKRNADDWRERSPQGGGEGMAASGGPSAKKKKKRGKELHKTTGEVSGNQKKVGGLEIARRKYVASREEGKKHNTTSKCDP